MKRNRGAAAAHGADLFEGCLCDAAGESLLPFHPASPDASNQLVRECSDDRSANAVQPAGVRIIEPFKFSSGMQGCQNQFEGRLLEFRMNVDGNAAAVITNGDSRTIFMQSDFNTAGVTVHG